MSVGANLRGDVLNGRKRRRTMRGPSIVFPVGWRTYVDLADSVPDQNVSINFLRDRLEVCTTASFEHEGLAYLINLLIVAIAEELGLQLVGGGSTTFRNPLVKAGMELDGCCWIAN